eukprot:1737581-Prymnesium_polylepis.2
MPAEIHSKGIPTGQMNIITQATTRVLAYSSEWHDSASDNKNKRQSALQPSAKSRVGAPSGLKGRRFLPEIVDKLRGDTTGSDNEQQDNRPATPNENAVIVRPQAGARDQDIAKIDGELDDVHPPGGAVSIVTRHVRRSPEVGVSE